MGHSKLQLLVVTGCVVTFKSRQRLHVMSGLIAFVPRLYCGCSAVQLVIKIAQQWLSCAQTSCSVVVDCRCTQTAVPVPWGVHYTSTCSFCASASAQASHGPRPCRSSMHAERNCRNLQDGCSIHCSIAKLTGESKVTTSSW